MDKLRGFILVALLVGALLAGGCGDYEFVGNANASDRYTLEHQGACMDTARENRTQCEKACADKVAYRVASNSGAVGGAALAATASGGSAFAAAVNAPTDCSECQAEYDGRVSRCAN